MKELAGLVLAGGRSSRFGSEKALALCGGKTLLEIALDRMFEITDTVAISAASGSGAEDIALDRRLYVLHDAPGGPVGPLCGILAGLRWCRAPRLAVVPCDLPNLTSEVYPRLLAQMGDALAVVAETADGMQPLCAIWRDEAEPLLAEALEQGNHPAVHDLLDALGARKVFFEDAGLFANVNRPGDLPCAT